MNSENQKPISKNAERALGMLGRVDDALTRVTFPFWKRMLGMRGIEMYKVESLGEQRVLARRITPIIENAAEIKIAEGDFSEGLFSDRHWEPDSRIRITRTPRGEAPKRIRGFWKGVEMDAYKLPASDQNKEVGLVSEHQIPPRRMDLYAVRLEEALEALEQKSHEAAEWFRDNSTSDINSLTFGANEVKVIRRNQRK